MTSFFERFPLTKWFYDLKRIQDETHRNRLINEQLGRWRSESLREIKIGIIGFPDECRYRCEKYFKQYEDNIIKKIDNMNRTFKTSSYSVTLTDVKKVKQINKNNKSM